MTIYPFTLQLGPLTITGYGVMMMVAFLMAGWAIQLDLRRRGWSEEFAADVVFAAVIGGIVGAKIWYVLLTGDWDALIRRGGFVWYGGFLGGVAGVLATGWWKRVPARWTMELTAAPLALGYALGRVGCFLVNDDYGIPSTLPWAMKFPRGLPPTSVRDLMGLHVTFPDTTLAGLAKLHATIPAAFLENSDHLAQIFVPVHPTQIYETGLMLLAFAWMWRLRDHSHGVGWRFGVYLVLAGLERFLVEMVRAKDDRLLGPFSLAQATSVLIVLAGVWVLTRLSDARPVPVPAVFTEKTAGAGPGPSR
jgi:phosphatidylglycerol---prolipoprotein diacylglyceryl transferase